MHNVSHFVSSSLHLLTGIRHGLHHSQEHCIRNMLGDKIKLQLNKNPDKESSSISEITKQYHYAVNTAAEHCSLGIRMLGMQQFINSLQIGPKVFEIPPNVSLSLSQFVSFCLCSTHTRSVLQTSTPVVEKSLIYSCSLLNVSHQVCWCSVRHSREPSCYGGISKAVHHGSAFCL